MIQTMERVTNIPHCSLGTILNERDSFLLSAVNDMIIKAVDRAFKLHKAETLPPQIQARRKQSHSLSDLDQCHTAPLLIRAPRIWTPRVTERKREIQQLAPESEHDPGDEQTASGYIGLETPTKPSSAENQSDQNNSPITVCSNRTLIICGRYWTARN